MAILLENEIKDFEQLSESDRRKQAVHLGKLFCKECEQLGIPVFLALYLPEKGYRYRAVFPEEIAEEIASNVESEYGKFVNFLKVCTDFNKEDYFPGIQQEILCKISEAE